MTDEPTQEGVVDKALAALGATVADPDEVTPATEEGLLAEALSALTEADPDEIIPATEEELLTLPARPEVSAQVLAALASEGEGGTAPVVYRYADEDLWRYGGNAYCSIPGIQGWRPLADDIRLPQAGLLTPISFDLLGIAEPPGGSYADIYAVPDGPRFYRASTLAGDFYLEGTDWIPIPLPTAPPTDDRPASELSVRIRRIRGLQ